MPNKLYLELQREYMVSTLIDLTVLHPISLILPTQTHNICSFLCFYYLVLFHVSVSLPPFFFCLRLLFFFQTYTTLSICFFATSVLPSFSAVFVYLG